MKRKAEEDDSKVKSRKIKIARVPDFLKKSFFTSKASPTTLSKAEIPAIQAIPSTCAQHYAPPLPCASSTPSTPSKPKAVAPFSTSSSTICTLSSTSSTSSSSSSSIVASAKTTQSPLPVYYGDTSLLRAQLASNARAILLLGNPGGGKTACIEHVANRNSYDVRTFAPNEIDFNPSSEFMTVLNAKSMQRRHGTTVIVIENAELVEPARKVFELVKNFNKSASKKGTRLVICSTLTWNNVVHRLKDTTTTIKLPELSHGILTKILSDHNYGREFQRLAPQCNGDAASMLAHAAIGCKDFWSSSTSAKGNGGFDRTLIHGKDSAVKTGIFDIIKQIMKKPKLILEYEDDTRNLIRENITKNGHMLFCGSNKFFDQDADYHDAMSIFFDAISDTDLHGSEMPQCYRGFLAQRAAEPFAGLEPAAEGGWSLPSTYTCHNTDAVEAAAVLHNTTKQTILEMIRLTDNFSTEFTFFPGTTKEERSNEADIRELRRFTTTI